MPIQSSYLGRAGQDFGCRKKLGWVASGLRIRPENPRSQDASSRPKFLGDISLCISLKIDLVLGLNTELQNVFIVFHIPALTQPGVFLEETIAAGILCNSITRGLYPFKKIHPFSWLPELPQCYEKKCSSEITEVSVCFSCLDQFYIRQQKAIIL